MNEITGMNKILKVLISRSSHNLASMMGLGGDIHAEQK